MALPNNKPLNLEDIDLAGTNESGVLKTWELSKVLLTNAEDGTNSSKNKVVNASIVSNSTKPTNGSKVSVDNFMNPPKRTVWFKYDTVMGNTIDDRKDVLVDSNDEEMTDFSQQAKKMLPSTPDNLPFR